MSEPGKLYRWRAVTGAAALVAAAVTGCGWDGTPQSAARALVPEPFFIEVDREELGLNGIENRYRSPVVYLLVGPREPFVVDSEQALLDAYIGKLRDEGWHVDPVDSDVVGWWEFAATRGTTFADLGRLSVFVAQAGIGDADVPEAFTETAAMHRGPLIVVSIEP